MKNRFFTAEYGKTAGEHTLPPEEKETLSERRRSFAASDEARGAWAGANAEPAFSASPEEPGTAETPQSDPAAARRAKRRRSLLLLFAASAMSVTLVTNSFGLDLLGLDGLFNDSVITGRVSQETEPAPTEPGRKDEPEKPTGADVPTAPERPTVPDPGSTEDTAETEPGSSAEDPSETSETETETETQPDTTEESSSEQETDTEPDTLPAESSEEVPTESSEEVPEDPYTTGLAVGGDSSFPILPNPLPNTSVPGYGVINEDYIQLFDRDTNTWEFLYLNPANGAAGVTRDGISYDPATNTLTLNNYHGGGISANLLGNSFTVELIGENELTQDFMIWGFYTGGSIRFTGNGSLTINSSEREVGLELICEFSTSCLMIEEGVTLDIYGSTASVEVIYTNAEKGIWYISDEPLEGIRQMIAAEETTDNPDMDSETLYQVWVLTDDGGETFLPHLHIGGQ